MRPGIAILVGAALVAGGGRGPVGAQSVDPRTLLGSVTRVFGAGIGVDTVRFDTVEVVRVRRGGELLGFGRVLEVRGKEQPITVLVAVDSSARLRDIDILAYREPYGGEVAYPAWRHQFRGKTAAAPLEVGRDIRGISGATISVNAVTQGVRRCLADFERWRRAGRLR